MVNRKTFSIKIFGRGEDMVYTDEDIELPLERTYCNGHRLYCSNILGEIGGQTLPYSKRREIIENLCEYFNTLKEPSIFVLDESDKDRTELEHLFSELAGKGHKITVEHDSAAKREQFQDEMYIGILKAGKKLSIDGKEIRSVEDYWKWKKDA
ncbi:hypothetical protein [Neptunomonas sp.]|uniref:hypothetical protein n=1 Tax=Neptunomonas sp. TaxID=1971898 RepID=UPI0035613E86